MDSLCPTPQDKLSGLINAGASNFRGREGTSVDGATTRFFRFVGTESRLENIFTGLDDILRNTTTDVNVRIQQLQTDAVRIQEEIDRIRATGSVPIYTPVQVNERFALLLSTARELLGDFRLVEENFKRIAQ